MFKGRHFDQSVILLCVRWYLAYTLSLRDLEEMMAERVEGRPLHCASLGRPLLAAAAGALQPAQACGRQQVALDETYIKVRGMDVSLPRYRHPRRYGRVLL
ncbi:hypothetical protein [Mesorhizobium sp. M0643]|uniref:hypothetical protein n=1 Tax=unclassified Mesorhizobium TaxID=325217 RepID=UPI00268649D6